MDKKIEQRIEKWKTALLDFSRRFYGEPSKK